MYEAWIGFAGAVIGGILTLAGVFLTIRYYKKQEKKGVESERKIQTTSLYWFLKYKIQMIQRCKTTKTVGNSDTAIPVLRVVLDNDSLFFFGKMQYIKEYLNDEQMEAMLSFYHKINLLDMSMKVVDEMSYNTKLLKKENENVISPVLAELNELINNNINAIMEIIEKEIGLK